MLVDDKSNTETLNRFVFSRYVRNTLTYRLSGGFT